MRSVFTFMIGAVLFGLVAVACADDKPQAPQKPAGPSCEARLQVSQVYNDELQRLRVQSESALISANLMIVQERNGRLAAEQKLADAAKKLSGEKPAEEKK